jgi:hypothetical protein
MTKKTVKKTKARKPAKAKRVAKAARKLDAEGDGEAKARAPRIDSKQAQLIAAMQTDKGISITEAAERFGWQAHTVRGAIAGAIKKKLGLTVEATKDGARGTVYRIAA